MSASAHGLVLLAIGLAAGGATLLGGMLALRWSARIHLVLGFSAGAVIGVALLDLLPEAFQTAPASLGPLDVGAAAAGGFLAYMVVDRAFLGPGRSASHRGHFGAASLTAHSLLDGLAIGLGFQVSVRVGIVLALAVLAHDLADGLNTVNLSLAGSRDPRLARRWLIADAAAPLAGIAASRLVTLPAPALAPIIAVFAGFFLYIGASELLPKSHHRHPRGWTTGSTVAGVVFIGLVVRLAQAPGMG